LEEEVKRLEGELKALKGQNPGDLERLKEQMQVLEEMLHQFGGKKEGEGEEETKPVEEKKAPKKEEKKGGKKEDKKGGKKEDKKTAKKEDKKDAKKKGGK